MPALIIYCLLLLLSYPNICSAAPSNQNILIVYQQTQGFSQQLINNLKDDLLASGFHAEKILLKPKQLNIDKIKASQLLIAVGSKTTELLLEANINTPLLSVLMPKHIADSLQELYPHKTNWSSLLIDQPVERQFQLITALLGGAQKVGIILGPYTNDLENTLKTASKKTNHTIRLERIENTDSLAVSLKALNQVVDVLLTLPDPVIYNRNTIRGVLLSSYRARIPIIGFSKSYVKAGAVAALYSLPKQISKQATLLSRQYFENKSFHKKIYYPSNFSIALNKKVARSLRINIKDVAVIIEQIKKMEILK